MKIGENTRKNLKASKFSIAMKMTPNNPDTIISNLTFYNGYAVPIFKYFMAFMHFEVSGKRFSKSSDFISKFINNIQYQFQVSFKAGCKHWKKEIA